MDAGTPLQFKGAHLIMNMNFTPKTSPRPESLLKFSGFHKMAIVIQSEVAECGLACLAMICSYHRFETDLSSLRHRFTISSKGTTLKDLMQMASSLKLATRALRIEIEDISHLQLPCVLHWNMSHFVVLTAIKNNSYIIVDPSVGERKVDKKEFEGQFTGVALELMPTEDFKPGKEKRSLKLSDFWSRMIGFKRSLLNILALSLLLQFFSILSPFYLQTIVDDVLIKQDSNLLMVIAIGFALLMITQTATTALREMVILQLSNKLSIQMSANLFRHLIRLPMEYFIKRHMGDVISRFGALDSVRNMLTYGLVSSIVDGVMAIITLIAMFIYSPKLTLVVIALLVFYALLRWLLYRPFQLLTEEAIVASAKENSHFMESIRAIQTIKVFQRENDRQNQWLNKLAEVMNKNIQLAKWGIGYSALTNLIFGIENTIIVYFAAKEVMVNVISLGMLYAFLSFKSNFISAIDNLITKWIDFKMLGIHLNRLSDIAFSPIEDSCKSDFSGALEVNDDNFSILGKIEVRNISFRYGDSDKNVFEKLSFTINPGETVAIVGPSGSGKTTLLKCLMGLIVPTEGEILIDDQPLKYLTRYRSQISSVMQEDQLLSGDMVENIACFSPTPDLEKVHHYAKVSCIYDEIQKMPMRFQTLVGDMGSNLSGGQKQRVILARALYHEPRILFMDEATSHLDVNNESMVNTNIKKLNITRVIVAHRPETVRSAGRLIELNPLDS